MEWLAAGWAMGRNQAVVELMYIDSPRVCSIR